MTMTSGAAKKALNSYWRAGFVGGLLILDGIVLCICIIDAIRFAFSGLSLVSAWRIAAEKVMDGESVGSAIAVLIFFVIALPMVIALISTIASPRERWPRYLGFQGKGLLPAHVFLSAIISLFTVAAVTMEVLSGWERGETMKYSFMSFWLVPVFLGKPAYAAFISPIIRKFLIRASAERNTTLKSVAVEVLTEENLERPA